MPSGTPPAVSTIVRTHRTKVCHSTYSSALASNRRHGISRASWSALCFLSRRTLRTRLSKFPLAICNPSGGRPPKLSVGVPLLYQFRLVPKRAQRCRTWKARSDGETRKPFSPARVRSGVEPKYAISVEAASCAANRTGDYCPSSWVIISSSSGNMDGGGRVKASVLQEILFRAIRDLMQS